MLETTSCSITYKIEGKAFPGETPTPPAASVLTAARAVSGRVRRACDHVEANLERSIQNAELAGVSCLSESYFARRFKAETGLTPGAYQRRARLEAAERLLAETSIALAEIAYRCGYCSQSHMNAAFQSQLRTTPKRYREAASRRNVPGAVPTMRLNVLEKWAAVS